LETASFSFKDFSPLRRRNQPPFGVSFFRRADGGIDIFRIRFLENTDDFFDIGWIYILKRLA